MNKLILSIENDGQFLSEESDSGEEVDQVPGNDYLDDLYDDESEEDEDKDVVDDGNIVVVTEESRGGGNDYVDIVYDHISMSDPDPPSWGGNGEDWEDMEAASHHQIQFKLKFRKYLTSPTTQCPRVYSYVLVVEPITRWRLFCDKIKSIIF